MKMLEEVMADAFKEFQEEQTRLQAVRDATESAARQEFEKRLAEASKEHTDGMDRAFRTYRTHVNAGK